MLALPVEAECLVDEELADERDKGHNDSDAMDDQTTVQLTPHIVNRGTYPRTTTAGIVSVFRGCKWMCVEAYSMAKSQWGCS